LLFVLADDGGGEDQEAIGIYFDLGWGQESENCVVYGGHPFISGAFD
jgi:hypothetical protein